MLGSIDAPLDGVTFTIGGAAYVAPPLTLGGIKAVLPRLSGNGAEVLSAVLCVALKRNYPDATQPWLDETMTGAEFAAAKDSLPELLRQSGLGPAKAQEPDPGEVAAAA
jgi:hypothetical protein